MCSEYITYSFLNKLKLSLKHIFRLLIILIECISTKKHNLAKPTQTKSKTNTNECPWLVPTNRTDADCLVLVVGLDCFASARRK